jgi:hypothetical protein
MAAGVESIHGPVLQCYGVKVGFRANCNRVLAAIDPTLIPASQICGRQEPDITYSLFADETRGVYTASNGVGNLLEAPDLDKLLNDLKVHIHHAIAESATEHVFLHAGVVACRGKAILLPGRSFCGKSALVRELLLQGAVYLSDEFAVLDEDGLVHPFPRPLSLRTWEGRFPCQPIDLGAQTAVGPMPVQLVAFTHFEPTGKFRPSPITPGKAMMELLNNVVAVRANPRKSLRTVRSVTSESILIKSARGEASETAALMLQLADRMICQTV